MLSSTQTANSWEDCEQAWAAAASAQGLVRPLSVTYLEHHNATVSVFPKVPGHSLAPHEISSKWEQLRWALNRFQIPLDVQVQGLVPASHQWDEVTSWTTRVFEEHGVLLSSPSYDEVFDTSVIRLSHGDCVGGNIMLAPTGDLAFIDPKLCADDPRYDFVHLAVRGAGVEDPEFVLDKYLPGWQQITMRTAAAVVAAYCAAIELFSHGLHHHASPALWLHRANRLDPAVFATTNDRFTARKWSDQHTLQSAGAFTVSFMNDLAGAADTTIDVADDHRDHSGWVRELVDEFTALAVSPERVRVVCEYGQSRSTATASGLAVAAGVPPAAAVHAVRSNQPAGRGFWPNLTIVAAFDVVLGTNMLEVCQQHRKIEAPSWETPAVGYR